MILSYSDLQHVFNNKIFQAYKDGEAIGAEDLAIGANSIDVSLSNKFLVAPQDKVIKVIHDIDAGYKPITTQAISLEPGAFVLATVNERFCCNTKYEERYWMQQLHGRSTIARLGLSVHTSAGFGDYGFEGAFTLEIVNHSQNTLVLQAGMRIAQVSFHSLLGKPVLYKTAYSDEEHHNKPMPPALGPGRF